MTVKGHVNQASEHNLGKGGRIVMVEKLGAKEGERKEDIRIIFDEEACNGCGICIEFCARGVLAKNDLGRPEVIRIDRCTECRICELMCPELAIIVSRG